jgi:hypothetical protein
LALQTPAQTGAPVKDLFMFTSSEKHIVSLANGKLLQQVADGIGTITLEARLSTAHSAR